MEGSVLTAIFDTSELDITSVPLLSFVCNQANPFAAVATNKSSEVKNKRHYLDKIATCSDLYFRLLEEVEKITGWMKMIDSIVNIKPATIITDQDVLKLTSVHARCQKLLEFRHPILIKRIKVLTSTSRQLRKYFTSMITETNTQTNTERDLFKRAKLQGKIPRYTKYQRDFTALKSASKGLETKLNTAATLCEQKIASCTNIIRNATTGREHFGITLSWDSEGKMFTYFNYTAPPNQI